MGGQPLADTQKTTENHPVSWINQLCLWPFSKTMLVYQGVTYGFVERVVAFTFRIEQIPFGSKQGHKDFGEAA